MKRLELSDKNKLDQLLAKMNPQISEFTFTNLFMWRHAYRYHTFDIDGFLWLTADVDNPFTMMPFGDYTNHEVLYGSIAKMKQMMELQGENLRIERVDETFKLILESMDLELSIVEDRNAFDYVYDFEDLVALKGNRFHKKKNHVNKFIKTYSDWSYEPIDEENLEEMPHAIERWFKGKGIFDDPSLNLERKAIHQAIDNFLIMGYMGGVIRINGQIEAFSLGEKLNDDTFVIHIEKANTQFNGLYNILNQQFLTNIEGNYKYINREQDLGIPGLRKAKMSYHPVKMIKKYSVTVL